MLCKVPFFLRRSPRVVGAVLAPWTMSLLTSPILVVSSACSPPSEEVLATGGALGGLPWASPAFEDARSALEFEELAGCIAGG